MPNHSAGGGTNGDDGRARAHGVTLEDGLELARRARASGCKALLVAVSGYGQADDKARAREAGFDDHLTKPISEADIDRILRAGPCAAAPVRLSDGQ